MTAFILKQRLKFFSKKVDGLNVFLFIFPMFGPEAKVENINILETTHDLMSYEHEMFCHTSA